MYITIPTQRCQYCRYFGFIRTLKCITIINVNHTASVISETISELNFKSLQCLLSPRKQKHDVSQLEYSKKANGKLIHSSQGDCYGLSHGERDCMRFGGVSSLTHNHYLISKPHASNFPSEVFCKSRSVSDLDPQDKAFGLLTELVFSQKQMENSCRELSSNKSQAN